MRFACSRWTVVLLMAAVSISASADVLEVRRATSLFKEPDRHAPVLRALSLQGREGPLLLRLVSEGRRNGFYRVALPGEPKGDAWIYGSYVRRYAAQHPDYRSYDRRLYRHWTDEDGDCQDTRQEVLIRDSDQPVSYQGDSQCRVVIGHWIDPYSGKAFTNPKDLDVDHVVPLKNAHESGAWAWSSERKSQYANYLADRQHLLSVAASENRRKGDKGPDRYMPTNPSIQCTYVQSWLRIKRDWELEMTEAEGLAVQEWLDRCEVASDN